MNDGVMTISLGEGGDEVHPWGTKVAEHRLHPAAIVALGDALDAAEADASVAAIVITAEGKYFSNGFDLKFLQQYPDLMDDLQRSTELTLARLLRFPKITVCAINGHACAAGAMLMLCVDKCVMNAERGFCFVPGVDLGLTYSPGMSELMSARLPVALRHDFIVLGQRYTASDLAPHGVVAAAVPPERVLPEALALACKLKPKATHAATLSRIKATLYHEAIAALEVEPDAIVTDPTFVPMGFETLAGGVDRPAASAPSPQAPAVAEAAPLLHTRMSSQIKALAHVHAANDLRNWSKSPSTK